MSLQRYTTYDRRGKINGGGFAVHLTKGTLAALVSIPPSTPAQQAAFDAAVKAKG